MPSGESLILASFPMHEILEQGRDNVVRCDVERDGERLTPDSASVSLYSASGDVVVADQPADVSSGIATYTISAATLTGHTLGRGWSIAWALSIGGVSHAFDNEAAFVRRALKPAATYRDLLDRKSDVAELVPRDRSNWAREGVLAWYDVEKMLLRSGHRSELVASPHELFDVHLEQWLARIYDQCHPSPAPGDQTYAQLAQAARKRAADLFAEVALTWDRNEDGVVDDAVNRERAIAVDFLCAPPRSLPWGFR